MPARKTPKHPWIERMTTVAWRSCCATIIKPRVSRAHRTKSPTTSACARHEGRSEAKAPAPAPAPVAPEFRDATCHVLPEAVVGAARGWRREGVGVGFAEAGSRGGRPAVRPAAAVVVHAEVVGGPAAAGEGGDEVRVRLGELRAQLRRRGVDGRGGRVMERAFVRRVQARRRPAIRRELFFVLLL